MKKRLTKGEKWLFAAPLLFLVMAGLLWQRQKVAPFQIEFPVSPIEEQLVFSPDGKRLAVSFRDTTNLRESYSVYDLKTKLKICDLNVPSVITAKHPDTHPDCGGLSWSSDGSSIVTGCGNLSSPQALKKILIWDTSGGVIKTELLYKLANAGDSGESLRFSHDGKKLIGDGIPNAVYDVATGETLKWPDSSLSDKDLAELNEKLGLLIVEDMEKPFRVVDFATKRTVWQPPDRFFGAASWYGDIMGVGMEFRGGPHDEEVGLLLWDGKTRKTLKSPPISSNQDLDDLGNFAFSSDKRTLVYFCIPMDRNLDAPPKSSNEIAVWDYRKNRVIWRVDTADKLSYFQWSPDGKWLLALREYQNESDISFDPTIGVRNDRLYSFLVFDKRGKLRFERDSFNYTSSWSSDSKQLAIIIEERDKAGNVTSSHLEIHRFAD